MFNFLIINLLISLHQTGYRTHCNPTLTTNTYRVRTRGGSKLLFGVAQITFVNKTGSKCNSGYFNESKLSIYES